jgi:hypothetical protein
MPTAGGCLGRPPAQCFVLTILYVARNTKVFPHFYIIRHFRLLFVFGRNI